MERNFDTKRFSLRNGTELTVWAQGGKLRGIAFRDQKPIFSYILEENDIRKLVKEDKNEPSFPNEPQLPIGFVMSSDKFEKTVPPEIELGEFIEGGSNGRVFECTSPKGYVLKVVHLVTSIYVKEPRVAFLKEVNLACEMGVLGVGPAVECFWIADGVKDLKGSRFLLNPRTRIQRGPVDEQNGDSFGFILSKRMDMTYQKFLEEYPESYFNPSGMDQDSEAEAARNKNRKTVQNFVDHLKKVCYERQVFISDLHFKNIMLNAQPSDPQVPQQGQLITDMRVIDFGVSHELRFDLDSIQWIAKIVKDIKKGRFEHLEEDSGNPRADDVIKKMGFLKRREADFTWRLKDIIRGSEELSDDES